MTSHELKTEALCWLRYVKRMPVVVTEVGSWNADVLGLNNKVSIEIETKISKADLRAEFVNKRAKHFVYNGAGRNFTPNYFYLLVPAKLSEEAVAVVLRENAKYGVLAYNPDLPGLPGKRLEVVRRAQRLGDHQPSPKMVQVAVMRMASEICHFYLASRTWADRFTESLNTFHNTVAQQAANFTEILADAQPEELGDGPIDVSRFS